MAEENASGGPDDSGLAGATNRRRFLAVLGALGVTGTAGCGGDGDDTEDGETPTDTGDGGTPTDTGDGGTPTDTGDGGTPTDTDTTTPTPTDTSGCNIPDPPNPLVSFGGIIDGAVAVSPDSETITGQFTNPYLGSTLESGSVELDVPEGDWTIEPASGTSFDTLEPQETSDITWNVSVPQIRDEFDVTLMVTYSCGEETYEAEKTQTFRIGPTTPAPGFVDFDVVDDAPARSIVRQSGHFTPLQLIGGGGAQMVYFTQDTDDFHAVTFDWEGVYDDGEWHHCVASYDAADGLRGYIDGETVVEQSAPAGELDPAGDPIPFGVAGSVGNPIQELYEGALDEVAVYDTALSQSEAETLAQGDDPAEDSLVSKWTFEEAVYGRVEDQVGDNTMYLANDPEMVSGRIGQAVQFDGDANYAGAPNSDSLDLTERKSVSFWFNTTQSV
jgi:hypothetical protein